MATVLNVYSLYDDKAEAFVCPLYNTKDALCVRELKGIISNGNSIIAKNVNDYKLFQLATLDETTGRYEPLEVPRFILDCSTLSDM